MIRIFEAILATFIGVFLAIILLLETEPVKNDLKRYIAQYFSEATGYDLEIGSYSFRPPFNLTAKQIRISRDQEPVIAIDQLATQINPWHLIKKTLTLTQLDINGIAATSPSLVNAHESPLRIKGIASIDLDRRHATAYLDLIHMKNQDTLATKIEVAQDRGKFQFIWSDKASAEGNFSLEPEKGVTFSNLRGHFGPAQLSGKITVSKEGYMDGSELQLTHLNLSELPFTATGSLSGKLSLAGKFSSPFLILHLTSQKFQVEGRSFKNLTAHLDGKYEALNATGKATLSFEDQERPYQFKLNYILDNSENEFITHLATTLNIIEIERLAGVDLPDIDGDVHVKCDISPHLFEYACFVEDASFESDEFNLNFSHVQAAVNGNLDRILLQDFRAVDELGGIYTSTGRLDFKENFPFTLNTTIEKGHFTDWSLYSTNFHGDLHLKGDLTGAALTGKLLSYDTRYTIPKRTSEDPITLNVTYVNVIDPPEQQILTSQESTVPISLDIEIQTEKPARIEGKDFFSEWMGSVQVKGTLDEDTYHGALQLTNGEASAGGRVFNLTQGTLSFNGDVKKATISLNGRVGIKNNTIELLVRGPTSSPSFSLRSTPPMSQREILSWILFNRGIAQLSPAESDMIQATTPTFQADSDGPTDLLTQIKQTTGLDRIEIVTSEEGDASRFSLNIGKYITDRTMVSVSRNLTNADEEEGQNTVGIETELSPHINLRAEIDDDQNGVLNLFWKRDY
ncbi:MAG: translocation/assembly module TamB [Waddliaceae bacterium]